MTDWQDWLTNSDYDSVWLHDKLWHSPFLLPRLWLTVVLGLGFQKYAVNAIRYFCPIYGINSWANKPLTKPLTLWLMTWTTYDHLTTSTYDYDIFWKFVQGCTNFQRNRSKVGACILTIQRWANKLLPQKKQTPRLKILKTPRLCVLQVHLSQYFSCPREILGRWGGQVAQLLYYFKMSEQTNNRNRLYLTMTDYDFDISSSPSSVVGMSCCMPCM